MYRVLSLRFKWRSILALAKYIGARYVTPTKKRTRMRSQCRGIPAFRATREDFRMASSPGSGRESTQSSLMQRAS